ncbi:MAG: excinuclease ABC subunit UvrA [Candidatus Kapaibacterium sp.]
MTENIKPRQPRDKSIQVRGARINNLKGISLDIPRNRLTVVTGVSGSGKSSLAFDTIYAEGQRRFVESLSAYARQFLERMNKPDVDQITGLPPAIAIEQRPPSRNPRSTVGTTTEIYDYLRLLYGRIGRTICKDCSEEVAKNSPASVLKQLKKLGDDAKLYVMFQLSPKISNVRSELEKYRKEGFFRVVLEDSNEIIDLETDKLSPRVFVDDIYILVDRMVLREDEDTLSRLADSIETAFRYGEGRMAVRHLQKSKTHKFSEHYECANCEIIYLEPEPRLFSFNNPYGACPSCQGFGRTVGIDDDLVFPDKSRSLKKHAIHPFKTQGFSQHHRALMKIAPKYEIPVDKPVHSLNEKQMKIVMDGKDDYIGVNGFFRMLEEKSYKMHYRVLLSRYRGYTTCPACGGSRLRTSARQVFVGDRNIPELIKMPLNHIMEYFNNLNLSRQNQKVAAQVLHEIKWRLRLLVDIGLEYLTLSRLSHTLSGGEAQRINLATALGSSLVGTLYVLDEPSIGMHPHDTNRLMNILFKIRNLGNTIIVVEHDLDIIRQADYIADIGPAAGELGGELTYFGTIDDITKSERSLTGKYLSGKEKIDLKKKFRKWDKSITIMKPHQHNLMIDEVDFPIKAMTVVTGISGSGKSTLVHDILYGGLKKIRGGYTGRVGYFDKIIGGEEIEQIELVDQSPIGRSSRSTPATYTKVFDSIRELFAQTQHARQLGYKPGHFSFNVAGGRCDVCEGEGQVTVEMQFLPDVHLECEACKGTRYKKEARSVLYKDKSIVDVLHMTIDQAAEFFKGSRKIEKKLRILQDVGLGYLRLGQPSTMLSGGESQRIKLANHLESQKRSDTLFIFDEPTTGLHIADISKLLDCFDKLVKNGHTVVVIEHNLHVIASADWIIDLGPGAGENGGKIVITGTPRQIVKNKTSLTAEALRDFYEIEKH